MKKIYELLSSMRFAISLLVLLSIASIAGTIIQQNMDAIEYTRRYGRFWVDVFDYVQLDNIYSAYWFLGVLLFLVISTSLCLIKNTPNMLREIRTYKENIRKRALPAFPHYHTEESTKTAAVLELAFLSVLKEKGFSVKKRTTEEGVLLAAKKGSWNRLGYIFAHMAIVLICAGGLLNGEKITGLQIWWNGKSGITENIAISEVPESARLPLSNPSFRGNMRVTEGKTRSEAVIVYDSAYYLQPLPFTLRLKDFSVEYYETGMPSNFKSEVEVYDPDTQTVSEHTIEVNHPLRVKGYTIYQSGLDDDDSILKLKAIPLNFTNSVDIEPLSVGDTTTLSSVGADNSKEEIVLELKKFQVQNVETTLEGDQPSFGSIESVLGVLSSNSSKKRFTNFGPSIEYRLRNASGASVEYKTYLKPVLDEKTGVMHQLFGERLANEEDYRFLFLPVDDNFSLQTFLSLREQLSNQAALQKAVEQMIGRNYANSSPAEQQAFSLIAWEAAAYFAEQGAAGQLVYAFQLSEQIAGRNASEIKSPSDVIQTLKNWMLEGRVTQLKSFYRVQELVQDLTKGVVLELYLTSQPKMNFATQTEQSIAQKVKEQAAWVDSAMQALADLHQYQAPFLIQIDTFEQVESSVFQVSRSSGSFVLYSGCVLLIVGVFLMLYVQQRRVWISLESSENKTIWQFACTSLKRTMDFEKEFLDMKERLSFLAKELREVLK